MAYSNLHMTACEDYCMPCQGMQYQIVNAIYQDTYHSQTWQNCHSLAINGENTPWKLHVWGQPSRYTQWVGAIYIHVHVYCHYITDIRVHVVALSLHPCKKTREDFDLECCTARQLCGHRHGRCIPCALTATWMLHFSFRRAHKKAQEVHKKHQEEVSIYIHVYMY